MNPNPLVDKISNGEAEIMKVLWQAGQPIPFTKICSDMQSRDPGKKSVTINTLLSRMVKKGVLQQEQRDVYYYSPLVDEAEYREFKTQSFVNQIYDGDVRNLLLNLATGNKVTESDLEELRGMLVRGGDDDA